MFIFLLITSELALLYFVFWYLYIRDPRCKHHIKGQLWGSYENQFSADSVVDPTLSFAKLKPMYGSRLRKDEWQALQQQLYRHEEFVLDHVTNHYVSVQDAQEGRTLLMRMASRLDKTFSELNVKP